MRSPCQACAKWFDWEWEQIGNGIQSGKALCAACEEMDASAKDVGRQPLPLARIAPPSARFWRRWFS